MQVPEGRPSFITALLKRWVGSKNEAGFRAVENDMYSHAKRLILSTAALILFLAAAVYLRWQWLALIVPGAILVWIGFVMPAPAPVPGMTSTKKLAK